MTNVNELVVVGGGAGVAAIPFLVGCYILRRNKFVYQTRIHAIAVFDRLPSYDRMMFQFWKWDYSDLLSIQPSETSK